MQRPDDRDTTPESSPDLGDLSEAEARALTDDLVHAMTAPLTPEQLREVARDEQRTERACRRLDELEDAVRRDITNLVQVESMRGRSAFYVTILGQGADPFGEKIARLILRIDKRAHGPVVR